MMRAVITLLLLTIPSVLVRAATTLAATPPSVALTYTKASALPTTKITIAPAGTTGSVYFTVKADTLPSWLQIDKTSGVCTSAAPATLNFTPSMVAANVAAGNYSAVLELDSTGLTPLLLPVSLTIANAAPTVTASLAIAPATGWTPGMALPTGTLTVKSSGDPVLFTVTAPPASTGAAGWINLSAPSAVAYSWGTPIGVTFAQTAFDNPTVGASLTGTIVVKAGSVTLPTINVSITVNAPLSTISSITPSRLPQVIPAGTVRTIAVQGNSFVNGMAVKLGGAAGTPVPSSCTGFSTGTTDAWCLQSSGQFFLRLSATTLAGAASTSNQLSLYLSAGANGLPGNINIPVVTTPIVYAVTDAASFQQPVAGQFLNVAPYEMLSIFGDNFGAFASGSGAAITFSNGRLPNALTDNAGNALKVHFTDLLGNALTADSDGYLLLWTPTQINLLVPSRAAGQELKLAVTVGSASSPPSGMTTFNVVSASPGLLTFGAGQGVIVNSADNSINSSANPAKLGSTIVLYLSGLGNPADGSAFTGNAGPMLPGYAGCATPSSFLGVSILSHPTWTTFDGALIDSVVLGPYALPPCFDPSTVLVRIGNLVLPSAVVYAGFTADTIAGLYQVNVVLPASSSSALAGLLPAPAATATAYPIQVSIGNATSQNGVNVYLAK